MPVKSQLSSVHKLAILEQTLRIGMVEVLDAGESVLFSQGFARLCGLDKSDTTLSAFGWAIHPQDRATFIEDLAAIRRKQLPPNRVVRIGHPSATARFISLQFEDGSTGPAGGGIIGIARDVTAEEVRVRAQSQRDERLSALLNMLKIDCIWYADANGQFFEHFATSHLTGIIPTFDPLSDAMVHPNDREIVLPAIAEAMAAGTPISAHLRIMGNDRKFRRYHKTGTPIRDDNGKITEWWGLIVEDTDETQRNTSTTKASAADVIEMTTGAITRASAALLNWTHSDLAMRSGLSETTVTRFCATDGVLVGRFRRSGVEAVIKAFSDQGMRYFLTSAGTLSFSFIPNDRPNDLN
ncbi:PAS domain-containing protein [Asticcacaulis sp. 201]|uniref:PAS domain-containing protein n=1 Tax=Asticcacaulis sp. 201 TaxID=3028787 RepID=UPI002916286B|nr:PAS domain-containing protein [Asticcacaulis sp. 201]MDV6330991.1 PAS domain-containing protein [Asticcacaulis sp. 201]